MESITLDNVFYAALASVPAILVLLWSMFQQNKRVEDIRDVLRAEIKSSKNETLEKMSSLNEQNIIALTKLTSVEEDLKRTLQNISSLNNQSNDFIRELTESKTKLEFLKSIEAEQKSNIKELNDTLLIIKKSTSNNKDSLDSHIKTLNERLNEIEKFYIKKLIELEERLKNNLNN